ncbi:MAG: hypothetical protein K2X29_09450 [Candidatus Obscuribacterales bacterium]|nr:hypothetical protein [Candidatus Obscuribacterales bacterium]
MSSKYILDTENGAMREITSQGIVSVPELKEKSEPEIQFTKWRSWPERTEELEYPIKQQVATKVRTLWKQGKIYYALSIDRKDKDRWDRLPDSFGLSLYDENGILIKELFGDFNPFSGPSSNNNVYRMADGKEIYKFQPFPDDIDYKYGRSMIHAAPMSLDEYQQIDKIASAFSWTD